MSYIYLGAAVQLLLIMSALRVTTVQALQATQSKQTSDALRRARARRAYEALRPDRVRPGRAASHRGRLLRSDAWFDAAGGPRA